MTVNLKNNFCSTVQFYYSGCFIAKQSNFQMKQVQILSLVNHFKILFINFVTEIFNILIAFINILTWDAFSETGTLKYHFKFCSV